MTTTDDLVHALPHRAKQILIHLWHDPARAIPPNEFPDIAPLLIKGLVNMVDGHASITRRGLSVLQYLATELRIDTYDRYLRVIENMLAHDGDMPGIEQVFRDNFASDELDLLEVSAERVLAAIKQARK